jgi:anti-anti-sigma factor
MTAFTSPAASDADFRIAIAHESRTISPSGELDLTTAPILVAATKPMLETPGDVTFDLGAVTFADSSLPNAVIQIAGDLHRTGAALRLTNCGPLIKRLFLACGLAERLN